MTPMPRRSRKGEKKYYRFVENFLKRRFGCFVTAQERGTRYGRIDVVGVRDIGGDLAGDVELIAVEVKAGNQPFSKAVGQAYSYSVCAERCYLADFRPGPRPYELGEIDIASKLGVGLLAIRRNGSISEILASPMNDPLVPMRSVLIENLNYARCVFCGSFFRIGEDDEPWKYVSGRAQKALEDGLGYGFYLADVGERKSGKRIYIHEHRYICSDCVEVLFHEMSPEE